MQSQIFNDNCTLFINSNNLFDDEKTLRKILINYPKRKMQKRGNSSLPLKINQAGVIPTIFASALLPVTFSNFNFQIVNL